ncbi:MAG: biotin/lipoyl-binding protein [Rhodospirillaceae bacterium]|nr:biotin/lipoyl-binding protein [Rhodospirillaceae bacterium]MBT5244618.1 biotin/lipoyl-binding protein [Rhodospirillaceae bacterium]MBT5563528.1 biotin/lipoyl-binding protein [Rhodospirillaceae bacterium]MBT6240741.1 biotin/lipoyl-binding protein [Rhodospirillaceae bacterium]MBT7137747.1 biotin/lipoyl-binding protein [Rhodospirillaceae bacterium]
MKQFLTMRRLWLFLVPVIAGALVFAIALKSRTSPEQRPAKELMASVRIIEVAKVTLIPRAIGYGNVKPGRIWQAVAEVSGKIVEIHPQLKKGAIVAKGTVLLKIDPTDYRLGIAQAEADLRAINAQIEELNGSQKNTRASLEIEERSLELIKGDFERKRKLHKQGTVSQAAVDQEERNFLKGRQSVQSLRNTLNLIPAERDVLNAQRAQNQTRLEAAHLDLARTEVVAPFDARIAEVNVEATQYTGLGKVLAVADDIAVAEVTAQIPLGRLINLIPPHATMPGGAAGLMSKLPDLLGFEALVRLRASSIDAEWPARFTRINDSIDPETRTAGVIVAVDDPYGQALPGSRPPLTKNMFVEVELKGRPRPQQLVIPRSSLHGSNVYVVNSENRLEIRAVEVAFPQTNFSVIKSGLVSGERIVVSDPIPAIAGMLVVPSLDDDVSARLIREAEGGGEVR